MACSIAVKVAEVSSLGLPTDELGTCVALSRLPMGLGVVYGGLYPLALLITGPEGR